MKNERHALHQDILEWSFKRNRITKLVNLFAIVVILKFVKLALKFVQPFVIVFFGEYT